MNFSFDYYKNLENPALYLCNPDAKQISAINARDRNITLRFNDLSDLTFNAPKFDKRFSGESVEFDYYSRIETKRLVFVEKVGWFQISEVQEVDDGIEVYKAVKAQAHQVALKDIGILYEERVYKFYDKDDPLDTQYNASDPSHVPSVCGQLNKQLGIQLDLHNTDVAPDSDYGTWTITYISPRLKYTEGADDNICRSFESEATTNGYDFMVNEVEDAFEVVFIFDFLHHAISVKFVDEITTPTNIYLSFENVMEQLEVTEKADDIVTVLNCNGGDLDIRYVNPTGTNYIVDFSYYMDEENHHWMSDSLIEKLKKWRAEVDSQKKKYADLVIKLRGLYQKKTELSTDSVYLREKYGDLEEVRDEYILDSKAIGNEPFVGETVEVGKTSLDSGSEFSSSPFNANARYTCYRYRPSLSDDGTYTFDEAGVTDTFENNAASGYMYFIDGDAHSFCKLKQSARVSKDKPDAEYYVSAFERYVPYKEVSYWLEKYRVLNITQDGLVESAQAEIDSVAGEMDAISSHLNIINYFSDTPTLLRELKCYWIEGEYSNDNLAKLDDMPQEQIIDLANELYAAGEKELARISRPRFSITVDSINFLALKEFQQFSNELELGRVLVIEKAPGLFYYPALTEMSFSLDDFETFTLVFANALKLTDWGFTYADLITSSAKTSKNVSANWNELMQFSRDKDSIDDLLYNPLDKTLRMAQSNMYNQEFVIDDTGILGRKFVDGGDYFEDEQIRIINNVIMFTDDGWKTIRTALGKVVYTVDGVDKIAYGLLAEVLVGSLILGNSLLIKNGNNGVVIDEKGIMIKKGDTPVFFADTDGNVSITGEIHATKLTLEGDAVNDMDYIIDSVVSVNYATKSELGTTEQNLKSQITQTASEITSTVEEERKQRQEAIEGLEGSLADTEETLRSEIKQTADSITQTVERDYATKSELGTTEQNLKSQIELSEEGILSTVSETYTTKDDFGAAKKELETAIEQTQESITAYARKREGGTSTEFGYVLEPTGTTFYANGKEVLRIDKNGLSLTGIITASGGNIGGFTIGDTAIYNGVTSFNSATSAGVYLGTDGINLGGKFKVDKNGNLTATNADLTGIIHATKGGTIGGFTIGDTAIYNGTSTFASTSAGVYLGTDGINLGGKFKVDKNGFLTAKSGTIGGLSLSDNSISSSNGRFSVSSDGYLTTTSGTIGGFEIGEKSLTNAAGGSSISIEENGYSIIFDGSGISQRKVDESGSTSGFSLSPSRFYLGDVVSDKRTGIEILTSYTKRSNYSAYDGRSDTVAEACITSASRGHYTVDSYESSGTPFILGIPRSVSKIPYQAVNEWGAYLRFDDYKSATLFYDPRCSGSWYLGNVETGEKSALSALHKVGGTISDSVRDQKYNGNVLRTETCNINVLDFCGLVFIGIYCTNIQNGEADDQVHTFRLSEYLSSISVVTATTRLSTSGSLSGYTHDAALSCGWTGTTAYVGIDDGTMSDGFILMVIGTK